VRFFEFYPLLPGEGRVRLINYEPLLGPLMEGEEEYTVRFFGFFVI